MSRKIKCFLLVIALSISTPSYAVVDMSSFFITWSLWTLSSWLLDYYIVRSDGMIGKYYNQYVIKYFYPEIKLPNQFKTHELDDLYSKMPKGLRMDMTSKQKSLDNLKYRLRADTKEELLKKISLLIDDLLEDQHKVQLQIQQSHIIQEAMKNTSYVDFIGEDVAAGDILYSKNNISAKIFTSSGKGKNKNSGHISKHAENGIKVQSIFPVGDTANIKLNATYSENSINKSHNNKAKGKSLILGGHIIYNFYNNWVISTSIIGTSNKSITKTNILGIDKETASTGHSISILPRISYIYNISNNISILPMVGIGYSYYYLSPYRGIVINQEATKNHNYSYSLGCSLRSIISLKNSWKLSLALNGTYIHNIRNKTNERRGEINYKDISHKINGIPGARIGKHNYQIIAKAKINKGNFGLEPSLSWHFRKRYISRTAALKLSIDF